MKKPPSPPRRVARRKTSPPPTPNSDGTTVVPAKWAWHYRTLVHLRERMLRSHADHIKEAATPAEMRGVDVLDTTQEQIDRDVLWAELGAEDDRLFEIDCAIQRIHAGVYGFCEETGATIPPARLRAIPWTRYCRSAAEKRETASKRRTESPF